MTLNKEQQELLHAWVDGETTEPENVAVNELLKHPDAQLYIRELKRMRELLATHGGVPAPDGLHDRVVEALRREPLNEPAPLIRLALINWRTVVVAAAAAVVVSLALVFSPPVTETVEPDGVATTGEQAATPPTRGGDESPAPRGKDGDIVWAESLDNGENDVRDGVNRERVQPAEAEVARPPETSRGSAKTTVLRLSPGLDEPFEVSINMDRSREASVLQVYNDILVVGSLHGEARILDQGGSLGAWTDGEEFSGRDFTVYTGVEIEVEPGSVPELLSAINRMSSDQGYGDVILPGYMRAEVGAFNREVRDLQDATAALHATADTSTSGAQGYLPNDVQRESLRRLAQDTSNVRADARLSRLLTPQPQGPSGGVPKGTVASQAEQRKVKLVIRLR